MTTDPTPERRRRSWIRTLERRAINFVRQKDPGLLLMTKGRFCISGMWYPVVLIATVGAMTRKLHHVALICYREGNRIYIVPSNLGARRGPAWLTNMRKHRGLVWAMVDGELRRHHPRRVAGTAEQYRITAALDAIYPRYVKYREWAARADRHYVPWCLEPILENATTEPAVGSS